MTEPPVAQHPRVAVLADDLIWATRLAGFVREAGAEPVTSRDLAGFERSLEGAALAIVDATARAYEPMDAVRVATRAGRRVVCVAQHDDAAFRSAARDAGAEKVLAYRAVAERGAAAIRGLLGEERR